MIGMTAQSAAAAARTVQAGSPEHGAACELCILRGFDPNAMVQPPRIKGQAMLPAAIPNWQWIIAEQILEAQLRMVLQPKARVN